MGSRDGIKEARVNHEKLDVVDKFAEPPEVPNRMPTLILLWN